MRFSVATAAIFAGVAFAKTVHYSTKEVTIIKCAPTVVDCPARSTVVSTTSYLATTTPSVPAYYHNSTSAPTPTPTLAPYYPQGGLLSSPGPPGPQGPAGPPGPPNACVPEIIYKTITVHASPSPAPPSGSNNNPPAYLESNPPSGSENNPPAYLISNPPSGSDNNPPSNPPSGSDNNPPSNPPSGSDNNPPAHPPSSPPSSPPSGSNNNPPAYPPANATTPGPTGTGVTPSKPEFTGAASTLQISGLAALAGLVAFLV